MLHEFLQYSQAVRYFIHCGFFKWASLVLPCEVFDHGDEVYIVPAEYEMTALHFEVNPGFKDEVLHVPTVLLPPACLPQGLKTALALKVTGAHQRLLPAALKSRP